jgi:branched-chain amino acid aminotransferase
MTVSERTVYLDGQFFVSGEARVPVDDLGLLYGCSVFETIRAYRGSPFRLERHLERMKSSCRIMGLKVPRGTDEVVSAVSELLSSNGLLERQARVRVTITGGRSTGFPPDHGPGSPSLFIMATPYDPPGEEKYRSGISVVLSPIRRNACSPLSGMKTAGYMDSLLARHDASGQGADDAVMLNTEGIVAELTTSNIFWVKEGTLFTPDVGCGILPGVTRETVLELCPRLDITGKSVSAGFEALREADEIFSTNSMVEILPVREIPGRVIPGCPGPVTAALSGSYRELVTSETASRA